MLIFLALLMLIDQRLAVPLLSLPLSMLIWDICFD